MARRKVGVSFDHVRGLMGTSPQKAVEKLHALLVLILDNAFGEDL